MIPEIKEENLNPDGTKKKTVENKPTEVVSEKTITDLEKKITDAEVALQVKFAKEEGDMDEDFDEIAVGTKRVLDGGRTRQVFDGVEWVEDTEFDPNAPTPGVEQADEEVVVEETTELEGDTNGDGKVNFRDEEGYGSASQDNIEGAFESGKEGYNPIAKAKSKAEKIAENYKKTVDASHKGD